MLFFCCSRVPPFWVCHTQRLEGTVLNAYIPIFALELRFRVTFSVREGLPSVPFFMAARLQFFSSLNGVKSKLLPAVAQRQSRLSLHTASSRWAKTPENFNNVLSWFAQVRCILLSFAPAAGSYTTYSLKISNMII